MFFFFSLFFLSFSFFPLLTLLPISSIFPSHPSSTQYDLLSKSLLQLSFPLISLFRLFITSLFLPFFLELFSFFRGPTPLLSLQQSSLRIIFISQAHFFPILISSVHTIFCQVRSLIYNLIPILYHFCFVLRLSFEEVPTIVDDDNSTFFYKGWILNSYHRFESAKSPTLVHHGRRR